MGRASKVLGILSFLGAVFLFSCLERDNPFDPINLPRIEPNSIRAQNQAFFDSLDRLSALMGAALIEMKANAAADSQMLVQREKSNESILQKNERLRRINDSIQAQNALETEAAKLLYQSVLDSLESYSNPSAFLGIGGFLFQIKAIKGDMSQKMIDLNREYSPFQIFTDSMMNARLKGLNSLLGKADTLQADSASWDQIVGAHGRKIHEQNVVIALENISIQEYNGNIEFQKNKGNRPSIGSAESLSVAIWDLKVGDSIFVDSGVFSGRIEIRASGTPEQPILIQGRMGGRTIWTATNDNELLVLSNKKNIIFKDIVFANGGGNSGARVIDQSDSITFERCEFRDNGRDGLEVINSSVQILNCLFLRNKGHGIHFSSSPNVDLKLNLLNGLIAFNGGHGILGVDLKGSITLATISDNGLDGIKFGGSIGNLSIYSSIIAFQKGYGLNFIGTSPPGSQLVILNCDVYGNELNNFSEPLPSSPLNKTINLDPGFISRDPNLGINYSLRQDSELLPLEASGIVIGWRKP